MIYADAHCHLTDERIQDQLDQFILNSTQKNIGIFIQGGIHPLEWNKQLELQSRYPSIKPVFGLHPMWVATQTPEDVEEALKILPTLLSKAVAIGEVGLDFRPQYAAAIDLQLETLQNQIEISQFTHLPLVWHLVRAFDYLKNHMLVSDWFASPGLIHAFNGSWKQAQFFMNYGQLLSIGGAITFPQNQKLQEAVKNIPLENLVLETDSPDQKNYDDKNEFNMPSQIWQTAEIIAQIKGLSKEKILESSTINLKNLFKF